MRLDQFLTKQLKTLPSRAGVEFKFEGKEAWLRCPFHGNGQERTPSLRVNLVDNGTFRAGSFHCHGCGKHGSEWTTLASTLGLRGVSKLDQYNDVAPHIFDHNLKAKLFGQQVEIPEGAYAWPTDMNWRNIKGQIVHDVGGLMFYDMRFKHPRLFLPVNVNDETVGGIKANIVPRRGGRNYFNTPGNWMGKIGLFPYDYVRDKMDCSVVSLVEGPRDALNLIQHGMAALCFCGAEDAWSEAKGELVLNLEPKMVLRMFDNDRSGNNASMKAKKYFEGKVEQRKYKLPSKADFGVDASDLDRSEVRKIQSKVNRMLEAA